MLVCGGNCVISDRGFFPGDVFVATKCGRYILPKDDERVLNGTVVLSDDVDRTPAEALFKCEESRLNRCIEDYTPAGLAESVRQSEERLRGFPIDQLRLHDVDDDERRLKEFLEHKVQSGL